MRSKSIHPYRILPSILSLIGDFGQLLSKSGFRTELQQVRRLKKKQELPKTTKLLKSRSWRNKKKNLSNIKLQVDVNNIYYRICYRICLIYYRICRLVNSPSRVTHNSSKHPQHLPLEPCDLSRQLARQLVISFCQNPVFRTELRQVTCKARRGTHDHQGFPHNARRGTPAHLHTV